MAPSRDYVRLHVNLIPSAAAALDDASALEGLSRTDIVNRAIQVYKFLTLEHKAGKSVVLRDDVTGGETVVRFL